MATADPEGKSMKLLDPEPTMFDAAECIGEGLQATLGIAIDDTAKRGRWELPPARKLEIRGQLDILQTIEERN